MIGLGLDGVVYIITENNFYFNFVAFEVSITDDFTIGFLFLCEGTYADFFYPYRLGVGEKIMRLS